MDDMQLSLKIDTVEASGAAVLVALIANKEIHRDVLRLDRADDRTRFIQDLQAKVPAIADGAMVSPESVDRELLALAARVKPTQKHAVKSHDHPMFEPDTRVHAGDRGNIGTVLEDLGDECIVRFVSPEGNTATKKLPKSQLRPIGDKPNSDSDESAATKIRKQEPFPVDLLPDVVRHYVVEGAEARAADPSIVALPVLVTLAACIGTTRKIAPKRDWTAPSILWGAVVARSGSVKSVGYDLSHELLKPAEDAEHLAHEEAMQEYRLAEAEHRKAMQQWQKSKDSGPPPNPPERPIAKRLVVDDQTVEGLAPVLKENPKGLYLLVDELRGFFDGMGAYSASGRGGRDESRWLTLFDGRPFNVDRKTNRERIYIPLTAVSVAGTIQPGTLGRVVSDGQVESGLLARLLMVMPEPKAKRWTDAEMAETTRLAMQRVIDQLKQLEHEVVDGQRKPIVLPLTDEAKQRFVLFVNSHGAETIQHGDALAAAWSKLEGYALRIALVHHLTRWAAGDPGCEADGPVGKASIEAGIELSRWFANEAERVYSRLGVSSKSSGDETQRRVDRLAEWLEAQDGPQTERDIRRHLNYYKRNPDQVEPDCKSLIDAGRAKWDVGRRTRRIVLLPPDADDDGDADASTKNAEESSETSALEPSAVVDVLPPTAERTNADTSAANAKDDREASPSPAWSHRNWSKRVRVSL